MIALLEANGFDTGLPSFFIWEARWFYAAAGASSQVRVVGPGTAGAVSGTLVETIDENFGSVVDQSVYVIAADGVRQYTPFVADPITRALDGLQILRYPLRAGDSYVQIDTTIDLGQDFDGDGRSERLSLRVETTVVGLETVTTAVGSFTRALHQRQVIDESVKPTGGSGTVTAKIVVDSWYAPDVGLVQSQVAVTGPGIGDSVSEGLTAYGVGSRRSESVAPVVGHRGQARWRGASDHEGVRHHGRDRLSRTKSNGVI